jgi:hypothetical protein
MSRQEFLDAVNQKIISSQVIDPARITQSVLAVIASYVAPGEIEKLKSSILCQKTFRLSGRELRRPNNPKRNQLARIFQR